MKGNALNIVELKGFAKSFDKLVGESQRNHLHQALADDPEVGDLIAGSGGLRKLRWARPGTGKSGGVRIIYYFFHDDAPLFLLTIYAKSEKENLSKEHLNLYRDLAQNIRKEYD
jgi:hypothetical protein